ncbi:hypothetical protein PUN28_004911 [Cardiocondyla obscurior]|uniref:Uncharacterized protein n=1 Tax=Cardiocondyla obscurior TaxID=286306 RepID=A0AAW2GFS3_9HYME
MITDLPRFLTSILQLASGQQRQYYLLMRYRWNDFSPALLYCICSSLISSLGLCSFSARSCASAQCSCNASFALSLCSGILVACSCVLRDSSVRPVPQLGRNVLPMYIPASAMQRNRNLFNLDSLRGTTS